ncbi:lipoprotein LprG [Haloechinothrix alba]|uniref:Lipoprotein LprG n=1 Tax=Haloechinothrix alba TaxID=664784 RepID=A0A238VV79_9PSEU|nr:LppX_LprAFG lipoprotein [Haloechinothrix alba]SNR38242.1 lipoprotein LprG [Haloechinothrix alba]
MLQLRQRVRRTACLVAATALAAAACTSDDEDLPAAGTLLDAAADSAGEVTSAHFALQATGDVPGLTVQMVEGDLTTDGGPYGAAQGVATVSMGGQLVESEFVLHEESLYLKGPTGGFQEIPADRVTSIYDPSAVLDPERGVAHLLDQVREAETTGTDTVDGTETHRVTGTVEHQVIDELIPGVESDAEITLWLDEERDHLPVKVTLSFPEAGGDETPTVDVTLSEVNEPVTVSPPE